MHDRNQPRMQIFPVFISFYRVTNSLGNKTLRIVRSNVIGFVLHWKYIDGKSCCWDNAVEWQREQEANNIKIRNLLFACSKTGNWIPFSLETDYKSVLAKNANKLVKCSCAIELFDFEFGFRLKQK